MRILITGATGFVGNAVVRSLSDRHAFTSLGRRAHSSGVRSVNTDLAEPGSIRAVLKELQNDAPFDAILHLAVSRLHRDFPESALDMFHVNIGVAAELLDFAKRTGVSHVVIGSTGTVYSPQELPSCEVTLQGSVEEDFVCPRSYFAASKLFADTLGQLYRGLLPVTVLRFYSPYGPGLEDRMISDIITRVKTGRPITLPPEGPGLRFPAVFVDDAVTVIERALVQRWNETINVAAPEIWSLRDLGDLLGELLDRPTVFERSSMANPVAYLPDIGRLASRMHGYTFVGLREGLRRTVATGQ